MTIGERIALRRRALGMTQDELARKVGYRSKAAISKIETNVNDISQSQVVRFAEALGTDINYLMGWEAPKEPPSPADDPHEVRMIARAGRRMSPEKRAEMLRVLKAIFPEEFQDDEP